MRPLSLGRILAGLVLAFPLLSLASSAQERETPHGGRALAPGRGDSHSKGWTEAFARRGTPLAPRFPRIGPDAVRVPLENGLVLYVKSDRRLPLVRIEALVRVGEAYETAEEYGLAGFLGGLLRSGGTESLKPDALDDRLAFLAANLSTGIGEDSGTVSLDLLAKDTDEGLSIFADVLRRPGLDEGRLSLAKRRAANGLLHRNDNPGQILPRELRRLYYPETHPSGRDATPESVRAVTRPRIRAFYERFFRPENVRITAVGDFDEAEMTGKLKAAFADWKRGGEPAPLLPKFAAPARRGVFVVDRPLNQSSIALAHPGIDRDNPDRYAVALMNAILGGGSFSSRITERVRSDEGLAYSARSAFPTGGREPELFQATVQTKTPTTARAVSLLVEEIRRMAEGTISKNEFETAKESTLYGMVFRNDSPAEAAARLMRLEFEGLPLDQDRRDFDGYSSVTPEAVSAAARKYLRPGELAFLVVGEASAFEKELRTFGEPTRIVPKEYGLEEIGGPGR